MTTSGDRRFFILLFLRDKKSSMREVAEVGGNFLHFFAHKRTSLSAKNGETFRKTVLRFLQYGGRCFCPELSGTGVKRCDVLGRAG